MEELIKAMWADAARHFERPVSVYYPYKVRAEDISHTALADYEMCSEEVFAGLANDAK